MTEDQFKALCNTYGFAPSRALREMLDKAMEQEREACAKVCDFEVGRLTAIDEPRPALAVGICAATIRARSNT